MIQIFKDRITSNGNRGFFPTTIVAPSIPDLFLNIESYIDKIPEEERYNVHYTLAHVMEGTRTFISQDIIPFDIDGIDVGRLEEYIPLVLHCIKAEENEVGIVKSGNGLHFLVHTSEAITNSNYFKETRSIYEEICKKVNNELNKMGLPGELESGPWRVSATLRLPMTLNNKTKEVGYTEEKGIKNCEIYTRVLVKKEGYRIENLIDLALVKPNEQLGNYDNFRTHFSIDDNAIINECLFIKHCRDNQKEIKENNWYKMLSIVARLTDGRKLCHQFSDQHPGYSPEQTDAKIDHAVGSSGPRTCANIGETFKGCIECKHWANITSPILIKGPDFIRTKENGFYNMERVLSKEGITSWKRGKPNFDDLLKYFDKCHKHIVTPNRFLYIWKDTHWEMTPNSYIEAFAEDNFNPKPNANMVSEFKAKVFRTNVKEDDWFNKSVFQKMNLTNGILDLSDEVPKLIPHSKKFGFTSVLNYEYDPKAECPIFDQFLKDVTLNRQELSNILLEYMAYVTGNYECTKAKALFLLGDGKNGKSKFVELLQDMVGENSFTAVPLSELGKDQMRSLLMNKLVNISEETPSHSLVDSAYFKALVSGGSITAKVVYKEPIIFKNRCKFISLCNTLPYTSDMTHGNLRRMLIVPFDNTFEGAKEDEHILDKLVKEKSGIFNKILEANYRLRTKGFTKSSYSDDVAKEYRLDNDPVFCFIDEGVTKANNEEYTMPIEELYRAYQVYCTSSGVRDILPKRSFSMQFSRWANNNDIPKYRTSTSRGYKNIKLVSNNDTNSEF